MAIQFPCAGCSQPIEVDDEYAGRAASCPYCQRVVTVPMSSALEPRETIIARRAGEGDAAGLSSDDPALAAARRRASTLGTYALICAALTLVLFGVTCVRAMMVAIQSGVFRPGVAVNDADLKRLQEVAESDPAIIGPGCGASFFALVGLVLSLVSMSRATRGNWRGIAACVVCGLYMLCNCGGALLMRATAALPGG